MLSPASSNALSSSVLVLNRSFLAIHAINVRPALCLLYGGLADVRAVDDGHYANYDFATWCELSELRSTDKRPVDDWIVSVNFEVQVPRVVRLHHYDRVPRQTLRFNRRNLFARDDHRCQYCGRNLPLSQMSIDHVIPRSRGGETSWENVVCCCIACNTRKGGRTPHEAHMRLLSEPRRPNRSPALAMRLGNPKYESWRAFIEGPSWLEA